MWSVTISVHHVLALEHVAQDIKQSLQELRQLDVLSEAWHIIYWHLKHPWMHHGSLNSIMGIFSSPLFMTNHSVYSPSAALLPGPFLHRVRTCWRNIQHLCLLMSAGHFSVCEREEGVCVSAWAINFTGHNFFLQQFRLLMGWNPFSFFSSTTAAAAATPSSLSYPSIHQRSVN